MSTWDELAMERADLYYPSPPDGERGPTYPLEALRDGKRDAFMLGAAWQRDELLREPRVESRLSDLPDPDPADGLPSEEGRDLSEHVERALRETLSDSLGAGSDLTRFEMLDGDPDSPYALVEGQLDVWHLAVVAVKAVREFGEKS